MEFRFRVQRYAFFLTYTNFVALFHRFFINVSRIIVSGDTTVVHLALYDSASDDEVLLI